MTPEQTLDWLAQQHFDQCREDRPVQHWIRKMKSELPPQPETVQVSPLEFVTRVTGKEEIIGEPAFWAQWPSKELNT
jgi:hypothetical protein